MDHQNSSSFYKNRFRDKVGIVFYVFMFLKETHHFKYLMLNQDLLQKLVQWGIESMQMAIVFCAIKCFNGSACDH